MKQIELTNISHSFTTKEETIELFNELDLTITSDKTHAIIGPSGVGKTSLLLILAGLEKPTQGQVNYLDDKQQLPLQQLKQQSGFIFQQFHLLPELDALNNVALPMKLKGESNAISRAHDWLSKVGLTDRATHKPNQLSGGEQQRLAIARAYVTSPAFIFADEPTGNLDEKTAAEITDLMFSIAAENDSGLVLVTHSHELASRTDICFKLGRGGIEAIKQPLSQVA